MWEKEAEGVCDVTEMRGKEAEGMCVLKEVWDIETKYVCGVNEGILSKLRRQRR